MTSSLLKSFKNHIFHEKLFSVGDKIIIGISGGADSVALTKLLLGVQKKFSLKLFLVHINYHLRGEMSNQDEKFVREFANKHRLEIKVVDYSKKENDSRNLEEACRDFRYKVFEKIRQKHKYNWIAVAHHRDDQAETFLMNLFRGAGIDGLKGMIRKDDKRKIIRPLLGFSKKELKTYLENLGQDWVEDKSNQDKSFLRNRIRQELIPEIEKNYSPQFSKRISDTSSQLQDCQEVLRRTLSKKYHSVVTRRGAKSVLSVVHYKKLSSSEQALIFREIIKGIQGDLKNVSRGNFLEFQKIIKSSKGKNQILRIGKVAIKRVGQNVILDKISQE